MMLVVGGLGAGKLDYVYALGYGEQDLGRSPRDGRPVLLDLQELLRTQTEIPSDWWAALLEKEIILCQEVGCGVVPLDPEDRRWREAVGRVCVRLAREADTVVRLVCGIPQVLKGGTP